MRTLRFFSMASAFIAAAVSAADLGGLQLVFEQGGEVRSAFVHTTTFYKPWDVGTDRHVPATATNGLSSVDNFTIRGNGTLHVDKSGTYRFAAVADDALTLDFNGVRAINQTAYANGKEQLSEPFELAAGRRYPLAFNYREVSGGEVCQIRLLDVATDTKTWISGNTLEPLPEPWTYFSYGPQTVYGSVAYDAAGRSFRLTGAGRGFMTTGDEIDTLTLPTGTDDFALLATCTVPKTGAAVIVARTSLTDTSCPSVSLAIRTVGATYAVRERTGAAMKTKNHSATWAAGTEVRLRLVRAKGQLKLAFVTPAGVWQEAGSVAATGAWAGDLRAGLGVFSRALTATDVSTVSNVSFIPLAVAPTLEATPQADGTIACRVRTGTAAEKRRDVAERLGANGWWWSDRVVSPLAGWTLTAAEAVPDGVAPNEDVVQVGADGRAVIEGWRDDPEANVTLSVAPCATWDLGTLTDGSVRAEAEVAHAPLKSSGKGLFQAVYSSWQSGPSSATPNAQGLGSIPRSWRVTDGAYVTDAGQSVGNQNFFSLWQGALTVPESGYYRFRQSYLNGCAKLSLDGTAVFSAFDRVTEQQTDTSGWMRLAAGRAYPIVYLWRKGNGGTSGNLSFEIQRCGDAAGWTALPAGWLSTGRAANAPVRLDKDGVFGTWRDYDIGASISGNSIVEGRLSKGGYDPDEFDLTFLASSGEGAFDAGLTSDAVHFLAKPMDGDFFIEADVSIPTGYNDGKGVWRRIGLGVRESPTAANARSAVAVRSYADGRLMAQLRGTAGGALSTFFWQNLGTRTARIGLERTEGRLNVYLDGKKVSSKSLGGWNNRLYVGFIGSSWAKEHQAITFFQNCRVKRQFPHGLTFGLAEPQPQPLPVAMTDFTAVHKATVTSAGDGAIRLQMPSAEWSCGAAFTYPDGIDMSEGRYLAVDVENLSTTRQMRLTMHVAAGGVVTDSDDHASAILAQNRSINTGIALNPGEKGTMRLLLPHVEIYAYPDGARGVYSIDTHHVTDIEFKMQWPFENEFKGLVDCKLSNLRLVGLAKQARAVSPDRYLPFIDNYGQFIHDTWPTKVTKDSQLVEDLARERAELKSAPATWDAYGGWKNGPTLTATGHFRTEKVNDKWWLVTPSGHLFFSFGINVIRTMTDASSGPAHPDWYADGVNKKSSMKYTEWSLAKKFGTSSYTDAYHDFALQRLDSWGVNTIGNWTSGDVLMKGRKPYVCTIYSRDSSVPVMANYSWYDCLASDFETKLKAAVKASAEKDPALTKALTDPMCIGFFIDNEPPIAGAAAASGDETAFCRAYFKGCRAAIKAIAPNKLYLGCRLVGHRQAKSILAAAGEFCDVVSVNGYCNSIYNVSKTMLTANGFDKPLLHGEFHFGCIDRGMFNAGLAPVGSQSERARSLTRFMQGALAHPLMVGAHWFQYRDQPLQGRGDGEAYQIGFVDVVDRTYPLLCTAAREVGENMYDYRQRGTLSVNMK